MKRNRYDRQGLLALEPKAFFFLFAEEPDRSNERVGDAEIVSIRGPLDHHAGWWCDSYDEILGRVEEACAGDAKYVVLKVDSPGGLVSGCFETARAIRAKCEEAGKTLVAYVDGSCCSAAYALASAATKIYLPDTGFVGSIGVIDTRVDVSGMDANYGVKFSFITSGARKADGNPHLPISKDELEERQSIVDALGALFFGLVSEMRGDSPAAYKALEARVLLGEGAVSAGLADEVSTFDQMLAQLASTGMEQTMSLAVARKALEKAAKGEGKEAEEAKRALAAMNAEDKKDPPEKEAESEESDEDKKDEESESEEDDTEAESDESDDEDKKDEKKDAKSAKAAKSEADRLKAIEDEQRRAFLDTRPDLSAAQRASVDGLPIERVRAIVNAIPKPPKPKHAATVGAAPTRGAGHVTGQSGQVVEEADPELAEIDRKMGKNLSRDRKCEARGNTFYMGRAPAPEKA